MTFNSLSFALFLPVFLLMYYSVISRESLRDKLLLLGSYFFYMSWYWQYAGLIAISTTIDFFVGRQIVATDSAQKKKALLAISVTANLGILAVFKYYNFFVDSFIASTAFFNLEISPNYHSLLLPVGISFYTFQTLSYTLDIYRGSLKPENSFIKFAVFVSFFPQLVAGPIVRAREFLPQLNKVIDVSSDAFHRGFFLIFVGLFKKIVIADLLAYLIVDGVFENPLGYSSWDLLISLYAYTFQIYCDFSGYSDIAIGVALLLGFKLPMNFNRPYIAQNPSEFWQRWHISLSSWLRDYLYISLGGNRLGKLLTARNLMLTMLLGGLWHGAAWNFIIWGAFHGLILIATRNFVSEKQFNSKMVLKILLNFHLVIFGWLLFRVTDMNNFFEYILGLAQFTGGTRFDVFAYCILLFALVAHFTPKVILERSYTNFVQPSPLLIKSVFYTGCLFFFIGASIGAPAFIYFQF